MWQCKAMSKIWLSLVKDLHCFSEMFSLPALNSLGSFVILQTLHILKVSMDVAFWGPFWSFLNWSNSDYLDDHYNLGYCSHQYLYLESIPWIYHLFMNAYILHVQNFLDIFHNQNLSPFLLFYQLCWQNQCLILF